MELATHVNYVFKVSMNHVRNIPVSKIRRYLIPDACQSLDHAIVCYFPYWPIVTLFCPFSMVATSLLFTACSSSSQNCATRVIVRINRFRNITTVHRSPSCRPALASSQGQDRIQDTRLMVFQCVYGHGSIKIF